FLHVTAYVVHGAVAVDQIQFRLMRNPYLIDGSVSSPLGNDAQAHFLKYLSGGPCIAADVIIADEGDIIRRCCFERPLSENVISDRVVCDMVAQRLAYTTEALTPDWNNRHAKFLHLFLGYCLDIVSNEAYRAFRKNADSLGKREKFLQLAERSVQVLIASVDDIFFLEVSRDMHRSEGIDTSLSIIVIAARPPTVLAAADRAVADSNLILYRAPDHTFRTSVCAATNRHDARPGLDV